jgi:hypothetical protein
MATKTAGAGILAEENREKREEIIGLLTKAYWMEIETVMSYIANSVNPDGVRAQEIIEALRTDIQEELSHAQRFAERIKELYGVVPGSLDFQAEQVYLQPPERQTWTGSLRTWRLKSCTTKRGTSASSRASCASTRPRASPRRQASSDGP